MNRTLVIAGVVAALSASTVLAQQSGGVQIKGNTEIKAKAENTNAVAVGQGNTAKNAVGAIKGNTQIKGNTKISAEAKNTNAVAVGQGNTATNDVGTIGK